MEQLVFALEQPLPIVCEVADPVYYKFLVDYRARQLVFTKEELLSAGWLAQEQITTNNDYRDFVYSALSH